MTSTNLPAVDNHSHARTLSAPAGTILAAVSLLILVTLVYWLGLNGGFILDDYSNIVKNPRVHAEAWTWQAFREAARAFELGSYGRPLATITFAFDHLIGGLDPHAYKRSSLIVHLINVLLVFWLLRRLLALPRLSGSAAWTTMGAFTLALLWAIHPLQISSVLYVVQRMETLAATFMLLGLIAYLRGRKAQRDGKRGWPWLVGASLLAGIGMLSKETGALFLVFTLVLELTLLRFEATSLRTTRTLKVLYAIGVIAIMAVFIGWVLPPHLDPAHYAQRDFTMVERLLTQLRVLTMYLGQIVLPLPSTLTFYYDDYTKSSGWLHPPTTLACGVLLAGLLAFALRVRERMPLVAFGILFFFAAHLLTSNVFALELVFEHRNYLALLGILLAAADLVRRIRLRDGPGLKYAAVGAVVLTFGFLATLRAATWGDPAHLASDLVAKNPNSERAAVNLATLYVDASDQNPESPFFSFGAQEFERASHLPNSSPTPEQALILLAIVAGNPVKDEWWERLLQKLAIRPFGPAEIATVMDLFRELSHGIPLDKGRMAQVFTTVIPRTRDPILYAQYGDFAIDYLHDEVLARELFLQMVELCGNDPGYPGRIAASLLVGGHTEIAYAVLDRADALGLLEKAAAQSRAR